MLTSQLSNCFAETAFPTSTAARYLCLQPESSCQLQTLKPCKKVTLINFIAYNYKLTFGAVHVVFAIFHYRGTFCVVLVQY